MRVLFRPEARQEILEARSWYEGRSPGLGTEFACAVDAAIASVARKPRAYPCVAGDYRRVLLRRFPYSVIYAVNGGELLVLACSHHRRHPDSWRGRSDE